MTNDLREKLAALEHEQWNETFIHIFETLEPVIDYDRPWCDNDARECVNRWQRQAATPYADLTEAEKDSDRVFADRVSRLVLKEALVNLVFADGGCPEGADVATYASGLQDGLATARATLVALLHPPESP